ncbi:MAG: methylmalonyl-CoA epimerase [Deltaproteobacteria bacterium]|nr:methylmalonyl-CoA epimerase [Deltaproteobacteria bacterium]
MLKGIDHVAIAVHSLDDTVPLWSDRFGFELSGYETVEDQKVRVAILTCGPYRIELMEPTSEDSPISAFLQKRGPGLHHVCLDVDGIEAMLGDLDEAGIKLINRTPVPGAHGRKVAFVHPKGAGGVLTELSEPS